MNRKNDDNEAARSLPRVQPNSKREPKHNLAFRSRERPPKESTLLHQRHQLKHLRVTNKERKDHHDNQIVKRKKKTILHIEPQQLALYADDWSSEFFDDEVTTPSPLTFVDNGQLDPFTTLSVDLPQPFIDEGIHLGECWLPHVHISH